MNYATPAILLALVASAAGKIYFKEDFNDNSWESRWTTSAAKPNLGRFRWTGEAPNKHIQMSDDNRNYAISAKLDLPFTNRGKDLVIQYSVQNAQILDCGGAYIKLMSDFDPLTLEGKTPYQIMFGPDICGPSNEKTHVIFNYPPKNGHVEIDEKIFPPNDKAAHLYTLHIKRDNSFEVFIDRKSVRSGRLQDHFEFLLPRQIKDMSQSKPKDWVENSLMPDPNDKKPANYNDILAEIPDPEAVMPDDWDVEQEGDWEPPLIDNPDFKDDWKPKMIKNPAYKGKWVRPVIPNPKFIDDRELYLRCTNCTRVAFELWMVKSGTIFDNIIVTDSIHEANAYADATTSENQKIAAAPPRRAAADYDLDYAVIESDHYEDENHHTYRSLRNDEL